MIRGAVRARDAGYDAYAIGHFQDGGLGEARSAVDLPVTGLGEASMLFACTLARTVGLITINPLFEPWHREQVIAYGLSERVIAVRSLPTTPDLYMRACNAGLRSTRSWRSSAPSRSTSRRSAAGLIPAGGLVATLFSTLPQPIDLGGPVFVNCVGVLAKHTEMAVRCPAARDRGDRPHGRLPARAAAGARRVPREHGSLTGMRIAIDRTRPLHAQPGSGHNRWHPAIPPLARVAPGETITLETRDGLDGQLTADSTVGDLAGARFEAQPPLTGPIFVEGAEPGDLLEVEILGYEHRGIRVTAFLPGFGFLADVFTEPYLVVWGSTASRATPRAAGVAIPAAHFAGVLGVAPSPAGLEQARSASGSWPRGVAEDAPADACPPEAADGLRTIPPRETGGNLDVRQLVAGSKLFLPVEVPGALFSAGDLHFAQGDGEVCGSAIEIAGAIWCASASASSLPGCRASPPSRPRSPGARRSRRPASRSPTTA